MFKTPDSVSRKDSMSRHYKVKCQLIYTTDASWFFNIMYEHNDTSVPSWHELKNSGISLNTSSLLLKGDEIFNFSNKPNEHILGHRWTS
jgi:hypothetical protein